MSRAAAGRSYEPNPCYPIIGATVEVGWSSAVAGLVNDTGVLAIDGPWALDWDSVQHGLSTARAELRLIDLRTCLAPWELIQQRTEFGPLIEDAHFATLSKNILADFFAELPTFIAGAGWTIVFGPGAALVAHDVLWYADLPKRYAEAAITNGTGTNLGQSAGLGPGTTRRLFYIDWPVLDRHRDALATRVDRWLDLQNPANPTSVAGSALRATIAELVQRPFRTRPTFNSTPWGGQWARRELGFRPDGPNTALGYELIAPESGVLLGDDQAQVEVPFQLLVSLHPEPLMGVPVHEQFGTSFPIRFDYLDTVAGGNLSVHCHPRSGYMKDVFGWAYPQHETYYLMIGGERNTVFLGLREDVDVELFHQDAARADQAGTPFDIERYVQTFPAIPHQLFLVPAGTPHGSGQGNVVLEISATPYLYSLRFYDWLRRDERDRQRAVHVEHAFHNLDTDRTGPLVAADLVQPPQVIRKGEGWTEERIGALPEMFFVVHRLVIESDNTVPEDTVGRFQVINVVDGDGVLIRSDRGIEHRLHYAETLVLPAAVGGYTVTGLGGHTARVVKAFVA